MPKFRGLTHESPTAWGNDMAAAIITNESNNRNEGATFVISQSETLRTICKLGNADGDGEIHKPEKDITPSEWVLHSDLRYMGQKSDNDNTYFGLVPKINGVERPDLAIMRDATKTTYIDHYKKVDGVVADESETLEIDDALRTAVREANDETLAKGESWDFWWSTLAAKIKGKSIGCLTYIGRRYDNKKPYQGTEIVLY